MIPVISHSGKGKTCKDRTEISGCQRRGREGLTTKERRELPEVMEMFSIPIVVGVEWHSMFASPHWRVHLKGVTYVNCTRRTDTHSPPPKKTSFCGVPTKRMKPAQSAARCPGGHRRRRWGREEAGRARRRPGGHGGGREGGEEAAVGGEFQTAAPQPAGRKVLTEEQQRCSKRALRRRRNPPSMDPTSRGAPYRCSLRWKSSWCGFPRSWSRERGSSSWVGWPCLDRGRPERVGQVAGKWAQVLAPPPRCRLDSGSSLGLPPAGLRFDFGAQRRLPTEADQRRGRPPAQRGGHAPPPPPSSSERRLGAPQRSPAESGAAGCNPQGGSRESRGRGRARDDAGAPLPGTPRGGGEAGSGCFLSGGNHWQTPKTWERGRAPRGCCLLSSPGLGLGNSPLRWG